MGRIGHATYKNYNSGRTKPSDKAPQQRAGPFPFETPRVPKSDGLRADPSPPYEPISMRKAPLHHNSDRVLSASKPQAMLHLFAGRTAHLRTITPTPHEQNQVSWAAMGGAEGRDTLQSSVVLEGTPTGTPIMQR